VANPGRVVSIEDRLKAMRAEMMILTAKIHAANMAIQSDQHLAGGASVAVDTLDDCILIQRRIVALMNGELPDGEL